MRNFKKIFALAAVAVSSLVLPACDSTDSSVGGANGNGLGNAECKPGDSKKAPDGCNTCSCQQNGFYACTEMACGAPNTCKPGETKKADDGCNTCTCTDTGAWGCTKIGCPSPTQCKADSDCAAPAGPCCGDGSGCATAFCNAGTCAVRQPKCGEPGVCKPGESKKADDGCNTCSCQEDGQWACTLIDCQPECTGPIPPCAPPPAGCDYVGGGCVNGQWTCGQLSCGVQCKPGDKMPAPDGCNTCTCTPDGQWACTEIGCTTPCKSDADCPTPPPVCYDCPDGSQVCPGSACVAGTCQITNNTCSGAIEPGAPCDKPGAQAPASDGCNTCVCGDNLTWGCTKIACVECQGGPPPCAAPPQGCDYVNGGCVNGQWTCGELVCGGMCKSDADCPVSDGPCQLCPDGTSSCPKASCINNHCTQVPGGCSTSPCTPQNAKGVGACAAFFGYAWDGVSCNGVGGCSCEGSDCGNLYKTPDDCKLDHQACGSGSQCTSDDMCPQPGSPCHQAVCNKGICELVQIPGCGGSCKADSDCAQPDGPCVKCLGNNPCAKAICDAGSCVELPPVCGDSCPPQNAAGVGDCDAFFGFAWNGKECVGLGGCSCQGTDCGNTYKSLAICQAYHSNCQ